MQSNLCKAEYKFYKHFSHTQGGKNFYIKWGQTFLYWGVGGTFYVGGSGGYDDQGVFFPAGVQVFPAGNLKNPQEILTKTLIIEQTSWG